MEDNTQYGITETSMVEETVPAHMEDYTMFLKSHGIDYRTDDYYIRVGEPKVSQGWILHLTVVPLQIKALLEAVVPVLFEFDLAFKVVRNKQVHLDFNVGAYGRYKIGKIITVYLDDVLDAAEALAKLAKTTGPFSGPEVYSDFQLSNIIYTRYGSFVNRTMIDNAGNRVLVIRDKNGRWFIDAYADMPFVPDGVENPFLSFLKDAKPGRKEYLIGERYIPMKLLKRDYKGDVWKGLHFSKFLIPRWCIIKQGRSGMWPDDQGRDITSRIEWQATICRRIQGVVPSARVIDYVKSEDGAYLITEYLKDHRDFVSVLFEKMNNKPWFLQTVRVKREVFDLLLEVTLIIEKMHKSGLVHRDITGANFLLGKKGRLALIDLELTYAIVEETPNPAFGLGTFGFMSPQQQARQKPTIHEDIYGFGSLMSMIFTDGMLPYYFLEKNPGHLCEKLNFFIREEGIVKLLMACIEPEPEKRPVIAEIIDFLSNYKPATLIGNGKEDWTAAVDQRILDETISGSVSCLGSDFMAHEGLWFSNIEKYYGPEVYPLKNRHFVGGLYRGVGGPLWLCCELKRMGVNVQRMQRNIFCSLRYLIFEILPGLDGMVDSYYYGKAGIAVILCNLMKVGFLEDNEQYRQIVRRCFDSVAEDLSILHGVAGQGLAVMRCMEFLDGHEAKILLSAYAEALLEKQGKNGAWHAPMGKREVVYGFGYGIAGIAYFLLRYGYTVGSSRAIDAAENAIAYLQTKSVRKKAVRAWGFSRYDKRVGTWWCNGAPGIALCLLTAFEVTGKKEYKEDALRILEDIPEKLVYQDVNQCHGLSGIGELYLEAFRVTGNEFWKERADWITNAIMYQSRRTDDDGLYWHYVGQEYPTADFMIGNSGVIHYLCRSRFPGKLGFPLL